MAVTHSGKYFHTRDGTSVYSTAYHAWMYISVPNEGFNNGRFERSDVKNWVNFTGTVKKVQFSLICQFVMICKNTFFSSQFTVISLSFCGNPIDKSLSYSDLTVLQKKLSFTCLAIWFKRLYCLFHDPVSSKLWSALQPSRPSLIVLGQT